MNEEKLIFPDYLRNGKKRGEVPTRKQLAKVIGKSRQWIDAAKRGSETARITQEYLDKWEEYYNSNEWRR